MLHCNFSTDATLSEGQRLEQVRAIANLQAYASNLQSAGAELERQRQLIMQHAQAKVMHALHEASLQNQAAEKRAIDAESNLRLHQIHAAHAENKCRRHVEQLASELCSFREKINSAFTSIHAVRFDAAEWKSRL